MERKHIVVNKKWGRETIIENNDKYCGKMLTCFSPLGWSSEGKFHHHKKKDETFYVIRGLLQLEILDEHNETIIIQMPEGNSCRIKPGTHHRFKAISDVCRFIEFSTHHEDSDSYRTKNK